MLARLRRIVDKECSEGVVRRTVKKRGLWVIAVVVIVVLVFAGHWLAHLLPEMERFVRALGPAGPVFFLVAVIVLEPLFFPNTLLGITAGVVFGLWRGYAIYFASVYLANLVVYWIGRAVFRRPILRALDRQPRIRSAVEAAEAQGTSLVFWIRLLPLNPAIFSYGFGGVRVPFRAVVIGTIGMFPHMLLDVYLGTVAAHVTKMAGDAHANWEVKGAGLIFGLVAVAVLSERISKIARSQIQAAGVADGP